MNLINTFFDYHRQLYSRLEKRGKLSAGTIRALHRFTMLHEDSRTFSIDKIALFYYLVTKAALDIIFFKSKNKNFAYLFIESMLPLEKSEDVFCTLSDRFEIWSTRYGVRTAKRMLNWHAVWIVVGHHWVRGRKLIFAAAALFGIKKIGDWMGRFF